MLHEVSGQSFFLTVILRLCMVAWQTVTAATAAAQAAAALGQLAAALAGQAPMEPTAIVAVPVTGLPLAIQLQTVIGFQAGKVLLPR